MCACNIARVHCLLLSLSSRACPILLSFVCAQCLSQTSDGNVRSECLCAVSGDDIRKLEAGVHIVSGTPGRVFDMIKRRSLRTRQIKVLVLDEADEMLNKGFREQIYDIYRCAVVSIVGLQQLETATGSLVQP